MPARSFLLIATFLLTACISCKAQQTTSKEDDYDRGYRFLYNRQLDSAFVLLDRYTKNGRDSLKKGMAYMYIGEMLWDADDYYAAQESFMGSLKAFNEDNKTHHPYLGYTYNVLGNISLDLKLYDEAIDFYNTSIQYSPVEYLPEIMNGKATTYQKKRNYQKAISIYDSIIALNPENKALLARAIDNRAKTKWLINAGNEVLPEFHAALKIRLDSQYLDGLDASYAHLADYYTASNKDSALWYATKLRDRATSAKSPIDILDAISKQFMVTKSAELKDQLFIRYKVLNDSLQAVKDTARARFAMIRYDVEKSKAENIVLQKKHNLQRLLTFFVGFFAVIIALILTARFRKRKKRILQETEKEIQDSKLKTSQKVHDVVANGLYRIMNELEHKNEIEKDPLINKIEDLYEQSRNISYEGNDPLVSVAHNKKVHDLLTSFSDDETTLVIVGNQQSFWNEMTTQQKQELQLVLGELMVNMKKHSRAKNVSVVFKQENNHAVILYKDDGVGLGIETGTGNGIRNTVNRIKSLNGKVNFEETEAGGLGITIRFPLQSSNA